MNQTSRAYPQRLGWRPLAYPLPSREGEQAVPPFAIGVIADLSGDSDARRGPLKHRRCCYVDRDNLDEVMRNAGAALRFTVPSRLPGAAPGSELDVALRFVSMDDFRPDRVAAGIASLADLVARRKRFAALLVKLEIQPLLRETLDNALRSPDLALACAPTGAALADADVAERLAAVLPPVLRSALSFPAGELVLTVRELLEHARVEGNVGGHAITMDSLADDIRALDAAMSAQLDEVLHHPAFRRLEATWRGLAYLVREVELSRTVKVRVLDAQLRELERDFQVALAVDRSHLYKELYDSASGAFGSEPYNVLLFDYELGRSDRELYLAKQIAQLAATISAPALIAASPTLFGLDTWSELDRPRDLYKIFDTFEHANWRSLREDAAAEYMVVVLPRLLARPAWDTRETVDKYGFAFVEGYPDLETRCWMSGAYGLACVLANAFAREGWCTDLQGPVWGRIEGLAAEHIVEADEIAGVIGPVEVGISERRHAELRNLGFTSITRDLRGDFAAFPAPVVLAKPGAARGAADKVRTASRLEFILCVSRAVHAIRCFLKDHTGIWTSIDDAVPGLQAWLQDYCAGTDTAVPPEHLVGPLPPFRSVRVSVALPAGGVDGEERERLKVELVLNHRAHADASNTITLLVPTGFQSGRLIP